MPKAESNSAPAVGEKLIIHTYFAEFRHESRAMRAIEAALDAGIADRVETLAYLTDETTPHERVSERFSIRRYAVDPRLPLPRILNRGLAWLFWTICTINGIRKRKPIMVQPHAVAALPSAVIAKWLCGTRILYDSHDLETERTGWNWAQRFFSRMLERTFIGQIDGMVTVSRHIADWYVDNYRMRRPALVRNIPITKPDQQMVGADAPSLRKALGIGDDELLFIYLGAIDVNRGLGILIDAFAQLPPNYHFATLGFGALVPMMEEAAAKYPNIHHHPAVPSKEVTTFIRDADVGICLIEDVSMNHRLTLPNKLFEARHGGLASLVSDLPAIRDFIDTYGGGWAVKPEAGAVAALLHTIDRLEIRRVMTDAKPIPTWADDKQVLIDEIRRTIADRPA